MEKTKVASGKSIMVRDGDGRFVKGNKEGRKFPKGYAGKPKGAKNKITVISRQFAEEVVRLDHKTGKRMTNHEVYMYLSEKADTSPRILNFFLEHWFGKPVEQVKHRMEVPTYIINVPEPEEKAEVVDGEKFILPEGD